MKTMSKKEFNSKLDTGEYYLYLKDIIEASHDTENSYYKVKVVANEVHLYPIEKPTSGVINVK